MKNCVIISGAPENDLSYYADYINDNSFIICADYGYEKCISLNITPDIVIGDFDSSSPPEIESSKLIVLPVRKDDTDTFTCVKEAVERGFKNIFILGGIGNRIDHTYSNILCVNYCYERNINCCLVNGKNRISIFENKKILIRDKYRYFSLFAFMGDCTGISIIDASYKLDNATLLQGEQYCQSNELINPKATIYCKQGKILLIESND